MFVGDDAGKTSRSTFTGENKFYYNGPPGELKLDVYNLHTDR